MADASNRYDNRSRLRKTSGRSHHGTGCDTGACRIAACRRQLTAAGGNTYAACMKIAFYSPLKSPNHPVPSGDRLMARLLVAALEKVGHSVAIASELRSFIRDPESGDLAGLEAQAEAEIDRLGREWRADDPPDLWFTYHPYYKAPDLLGPPLARAFGIAYVTAEASYSARRNIGAWQEVQASVAAALRQAAVNICFTTRDREGLAEAVPGSRLVSLLPFIEPSPFLVHEPRPQPGRLIAVAMMRAGDKMESYAMLADALKRLNDAAWTLSIVGDGPCRQETQAFFSDFDPSRLIWHGEQKQAAIAALLSESAIYVWPGCGEAYGLAYLEAQAAGLPVVAQTIAGVPEVVISGRTGLLTPQGDVAAYALAIRRLLDADEERTRLATQARQFVRDERSLDRAATTLDRILQRAIGGR